MCGGCLYLDMPDEEYIHKKQNFVRRAFADKGIDLPGDLPFVRIPFGSRRRACFAFYKGHVGFNAAKSHKIIDLDGCPALVNPLSDLIGPLKKLVRVLKSSGDIYVLNTPVGVDMHIKMGKEKPGFELIEALTEFAQNNPVVRLYFNDDPILEKAPLPFKAGVFLQPSAEGEKALIDLLMSETAGVKTAVDLFCGTGTFTKPLIAAEIKAIGYDSEKDSVAGLGVDGVVRDLFRNPVTAAEIGAPDLIVIDPPRAGALAQIEQIKDVQARKIVMISCNPATAARDAKALIDSGWKMQKITLVDQFSYTNHIELFCVFER